MFIEPSNFDFVATLEASWRTIRDELISLPDELFDPWVQRDMHGGSWRVHALYALGKRIEPACMRCPQTAAIIDDISGVSLAGFSRLAAQTHIEPHVGWAKSVYRLHLGLVVPAGCALRVGAETCAWEEGQCLVFDDTVEHEAWNHSSQPRTTLLLDFLRPGIDDFCVDSLPAEVRRYAKRLLR